MQGSFVNQAQNNHTLTLSSGETLTVRRRLTAGERRAAFAVMLTGSTVRPDGTRAVNPLMIGVGTVIAYLKSWTITDDAGQLVPYADESTEDQIAILDDLEDSEFDEIRLLIDAHENAMLAERAEKKRARNGAPVSSPTPPSRDTTASTLQPSLA